MIGQHTDLITPQSDIENFTRFEFKYVLNSERAGLVEGDIKQFMTHDGHISSLYDENYYVRSLYYDDLQRQNYYEKIDGVKSRRKYRLRTYTPERDTAVPVFLEEKNRIDNRVFKYRMKLDLEYLAHLDYDGDVVQLKKSYPNNALIDRFTFRHIRSQERPVVVVSYLRRAFVSDFDINFRITLDSKLQAAPSRHLFGELPGELEAAWLAIQSWKSSLLAEFLPGSTASYKPINCGACRSQNIVKRWKRVDWLSIYLEG